MWRSFGHEKHEHLELGQTGYVAYPLQGAPESLHQLFHFLAAQDQPYLVSVGLRPAELEPEERDSLGAIASACREQARRTEQAVTQSVEMVSIPAGDVADLYTLYLRRLHNPFELRLSVASPGPIEPGLLSALCSDLSHPFEAGEPARQVPNKKGDFVAPGDEHERQAAVFNLRYLDFIDWTPHMAAPRHAALGRLRRLVDAEAATSVFRVPIPPVGGLPGVDSRPPSLFEPLPEELLHPPPGTATVSLGPVLLSLRVLTQHALVAGTIGSGKTNTCVQLLHKLWAEHRVPFLVIEPVNAEHDDYRSLGRHFPVPEELRVFTLGDESTSPLRFNPFELPEGVILNTHLSGLMACFMAALPMDDGPLPALFREALRNIFFAKGWRDDERGGERKDQEVPSLHDLRDELDWLIRERYGQHTEVAQTLVGASVTRVNALINSTAGRILLAKRSLPLAELFEQPTILELRHLGSEEDKALMTGFLLLALQEYCDRNRQVGSGRLHHVVLLEEAHNLMEETGGDGDDSKAAAVKFFTNMLAENRKYGQGFIVVEQIPSLLAQGAIKNTVTKLMHRMPGADDVELMGATMNFKERHRTRAVALRPREGEAFIYTDALSEATLVNVDYFEKDDPLQDRELCERMEAFRRQYSEVYAEELPFADCRFCPAQCRFRRRVERLAFDRELGARVLSVYEKADTSQIDRSVRELMTPVYLAVEDLGFADNDRIGAGFCAILHLESQVKRLRHVVHSEGFRKRIGL